MHTTQKGGLSMEENNNFDGEELEEIVRRECGRRMCKCGDCDCEYGTDFFNEDGTPTSAFGKDQDLKREQQLEAAADYSDYANRVGTDEITENGEIKYRNTAEYRMIDPDGESVDSSKS